MLFTVVITLIGAIVFGFTTAFHENTKDLEHSLRENTISSAGRSRMRSRQILVIGQIACAIALLSGSGELIRSFWKLMHVDSGVNSSHLLTTRVDLPVVKYRSPESVAAFCDQAIDRIRSLATMGIPILQGRNFPPEERKGNEKAAVVNQTTARTLWKDKDPIGYRLRGGLTNSEHCDRHGIRPCAGCSTSQAYSRVFFTRRAEPIY